MGCFQSAGLFTVAVFMGVVVTAFIRWPPAQSSDWAAWLQAVGSIGAIVGAIWIASAQSRREIAHREQTEKRDAYLLEAELSWLTRDIADYIRQLINLRANVVYNSLPISDDDILNLLERVSWCRQRASHKGQLAMLGDVRDAMMRTTRLIRMKEKGFPTSFSQQEVDFIHEQHRTAVVAFNSATGVNVLPQYQP
ncbi:hypothetical protein [Paraburkholderia kururiensis]|uniref:hypothetical protein n=1 Tax=Paraburkholderia kururiensis TaxID=984307 RepID=UPI000694E8A9|nr:hypothetical protein [Paraburkholderia kururiensis]